MNKKISDKDKKDWESFISNNEKLEDKDQFLIRKNYKIKTLDLHGLSLDKANKTVEKFIVDSHNSNVSKLIIVTGKGLIHKMKKIHMFLISIVFCDILFRSI